MLDEDGGEGEIAMHNVILVQIAAERNLLLYAFHHAQCLAARVHKNVRLEYKELVTT